MLRGDDRAQSVQVGAILLFGILIVALATAQATVIPQQNAGIEFDHSQTIQSDMQELRNGILRAATGPASPVRLSLGTRFPNRMVFINPPPPSGRLRTVGDESPAMNVTLADANVESDYPNAEAYWANAPDAGVYNTAGVVYTPDYAEYDNAPTTVYENTLLLNRFDNGQHRTISGQRLVQGNTINLFALRGDLDASRAGAYTAELTTVSESARTVTVHSEPNDQLTINVTSSLPASVWNESLLGDRATAIDAGNTTVDGERYHRVSIELDPGTYKLRAGAAGVGALTDNESVTEPAYMVVTDEYEPTANGSEGSMTVEVRDRFNNPVTGTDVSVRVDSDNLELFNDTTAGSQMVFETDSDGEATINYRGINATTSGESAWLNASLPGAGASYEYQNRSDIVVPAIDLGDGDGGELNPGTTGTLIQTGATLTNNENVNVAFNNTLSGQVNVTSLRINFYYQYSGPRGSTAEMSPATVSYGGTTASNVNISGKYRKFEVQVAEGEQPVLNFDFNSGAQIEDFFVLSIVFEYDGQTYRETYFISPE